MMMTPRELEKYSSAFTLSDMEIFIFPELLYAQVLANILSPEIWKWRDDKWFRDIEKMPPLKRIHRVKQYIMDHYDFNLDLDTWGLTDKETEINRFRDFMDREILRKSNALFGYEGDKYYFDIDIRKHFGLDKYNSDIIPYWKTETIEAMNAFRFKPGRKVGAGECVSLAALYAAALFIVARIPLENIFLMGTPLHSQNYILAENGVLTNNRRIVTRAMWYNGTELSALARRALEHEQVTVVAHATGYIHSIYQEATIDPGIYTKFRESLNRFLNSSVTFEGFINFLRSFHRYQPLFQLSCPCQGSPKYIPLEKAFSYEHGSKNRLGDKTSKKLLCEMGDEDLSFIPIENRAILLVQDPLFSPKSISEFLPAFRKQYPELDSRKDLRDNLRRFFHTTPRLPGGEKVFTGGQEGKWGSGQAREFEIKTDMSREEILAYLSSLRSSSFVPRPSSYVPRPTSLVSDLAFYAGRFMDHIDWTPFLKAAFERNPVSVAYFKDTDFADIHSQLLTWPGSSIYEGNRLSLPDEVVNFIRGDGIEKALTLANVIKSRHPGEKITLTVCNREVVLKSNKKQFHFQSEKHVTKQVIY